MTLTEYLEAIHGRDLTAEETAELSTIYVGPTETFDHADAPYVGHERSYSYTELTELAELSGCDDLAVLADMADDMHRLTALADGQYRAALADPTNVGDGTVRRPTVAPPDPFTGRDHRVTAKRSNRGTTTRTVTGYGVPPVIGRSDVDVNGHPTSDRWVGAVLAVEHLARPLVHGRSGYDILTLTQQMAGDALDTVTLADGRTVTLLGSETGSKADLTDVGHVVGTPVAVHRSDISGSAPDDRRTVHALAEYVGDDRLSWSTVTHDRAADRATGHPHLDWPLVTRIPWPIYPGRVNPETGRPVTAGPRASEYGQRRTDLVAIPTGRTVTFHPLTAFHPVIRDQLVTVTARTLPNVHPDTTHEAGTPLWVGHQLAERGQLSDRSASRHSIGPRSQATVAELTPDQTPDSLAGWRELLTAVDIGQRMTGQTAEGDTWTLSRSKTAWSGTVTDKHGHRVTFNGRRTLNAAAGALYTRT